MQRLNWLCTLALCSVSSTGLAWDIRGNIGLEFRQFPNNAVYYPFEKSNVSVSGETEFYQTIGDSGSLTITPFFRVDQHDDERTHIDLREFVYTHVGDTWELNAGVGKVFWGVAESQNIVDIINQTDQVENGSGSEKLGQPMVNLKLFQDWGTVDLFVLPGFRERTFLGEGGRPRSPLIVDTDNALYENDAENQHVDLAVRYSHTLDVWDFGIHAFHGTARDPLLQPSSTGQLQPFYYQSTQIGTDIQATLESWLLKLEAIYKTGDAIENHAELVGGFEYSFYGIADSAADLGVVAELLYDDREDAQPFQKDLLVGLRWVQNNESSSEALLGIIQDLDHGTQTLSLEASTRIGNSVKLSGELTLWHNTDDDPFFATFDEEDYLQLDLRYFF
ncbi:MAG: hypothetical protein KTR35_23235 [Gammaproteobacteria bacterium]|nr:hypothetical protein [Gammaproteobacteria bacterium]